MKLILISRVANLGNVGDIVSVRSGYGKNFLVPQKKAIFYNAANYKSFEEKKQQFEVENQKHLSAAEGFKSKLNGKDVVIIGTASDDGRLYGAVTTAIIAAKINEILNSKAVSRIDVLLKKPIKDVGVYDVKIDLYSGIAADVRVIVSRSDSEVAAMVAGAKSDVEVEVQEKSEKKSVKKSKKSTTKDEAAEVAAA